MHSSHRLPPFVTHSNRHRESRERIPTLRRIGTIAVLLTLFFAFRSSEATTVPPTAWIGIFAESIRVQGPTALELEIGMRCPEGEEVTSFVHRIYEYRVGSPQELQPQGDPVNAPGPPEEIRREKVVFEPVPDEDLQRICPGDAPVAIEPRILVEARCSSSRPAWSNWIVIPATVHCEGTEAGVHEPSVKVEPGPPPDERRRRPYLAIYSSTLVDSGRIPDEAYGTAFGLRLGFSGGERWGLELAVGRQELEPANLHPDLSAPPGGAMLTADLHWIYRLPIADRIQVQFFLGPGWQLVDHQSPLDESPEELLDEGFAPSAGTGLEVDFARRFFVEARVLSRWRETRGTDSRTTEGLLALGLRF